MGTLTVQKVYDSYAAFYNFIFGRIFKPGRESCVDIVNQNAALNSHILEVGVGTGLSLPSYRHDLKITGIDISEKMLAKAKERVAAHQLGDRIALHVMDAEHLEFPDEKFDVVVAMYVVSVVPDFQKFMAEISRVCKKKGDIVIVNHFGSQHKVMRTIEKFLAGAHAVIGFKSDFAIDQVLNYDQLSLLSMSKTNLFGYWKTLHFKKR
jgi:phosphatidylethanolamine/phosphatidyl-N-methylethanolamine N-methyltransferase